MRPSTTDPRQPVMTQTLSPVFGILAFLNLVATSPAAEKLKADHANVVPGRHRRHERQVCRGAHVFLSAASRVGGSQGE